LPPPPKIGPGPTMLPHSPAAGPPRLPIVGARLTLVVLSAVVSANLRNKFKRVGGSQEFARAALQGQLRDGYDS
jgi:hypothetical protein